MYAFRIRRICYGTDESVPYSQKKGVLRCNTPIFYSITVPSGLNSGSFSK